MARFKNERWWRWKTRAKLTRWLVDGDGTVQRHGGYRVGWVLMLGGASHQHQHQYGYQHGHQHRMHGSSSSLIPP